MRNRPGKGSAQERPAAQSAAEGPFLPLRFYLYPARFSPEFVRAMIGEFTTIGDLIYDPFMGGGTTLVEAMGMGRNSVGTDISSLATFISKVKTTVYTKAQVEAVSKWIARLAPLLNVGTEVPVSAKWIRTDYQRNINDRGADFWGIGYRRCFEYPTCASTG